MSRHEPPTEGLHDEIRHEIVRMGAHPIHETERLATIASAGEHGSTMAIVLVGMAMLATGIVATVLALVLGVSELVTG